MYIYSFEIPYVINELKKRNNFKLFQFTLSINKYELNVKE